MAHKKTTSPKVASKAARQLADPKTPKKYRPALGSAVSQSAGKHRKPKK